MQTYTVMIFGIETGDKRKVKTGWNPITELRKTSIGISGGVYSWKYTETNGLADLFHIIMVNLGDGWIRPEGPCVEILSKYLNAVTGSMQ